MDIECRECRPDEAMEACAFTETIFGPMLPGYWEKEPGLTASMAWQGDELVGVIPLSLRNYQLAPGVVASTAWENAVGTREDMRGRGVGTQMIDAAREFLRDRCDLLCVYRGGERSAGYRFYADKTDHVDLAYVAFYTVQNPGGHGPSGWQVAGDHEAVAEQSETLTKLFNSHWGAYGGFPVHDEAYYPWVIDNMIFGRIPMERRLHTLSDNGHVVGFAITGIRQAHRADGRVVLLDFAVADGDLRRADRLMRGVLAYAASEGMPLVWATTVSTPLLPLFEALGFERGQRRMQLMGYPLRPTDLFGKLASARGGCDVTLDVWTPKVDYRLWDAGAGAPRATLEMKDDTLVRLLCSRLDARSALEEERLTLTGPAPTDRVRRVLERVGRCVPWVHHYLEWL